MNNILGLGLNKNIKNDLTKAVDVRPIIKTIASGLSLYLLKKFLKLLSVTFTSGRIE